MKFASRVNLFLVVVFDGDVLPGGNPPRLPLPSILELVLVLPNKERLFLPLAIPINMGYYNLLPTNS